MIPTGGFIEEQPPKYIVPYYDPDKLKKLEATLTKAAVYLDKANAASWWKSWMQHAQKNITHLEPQDLQGIVIMHTCIYMYVYMCKH